MGWTKVKYRSDPAVHGGKGFVMESHPRKSILVVVSAALLVMTFGNVAALAAGRTVATGFNYEPRISFVQVSPDTVIPLAVPLCKTTDTTVPTFPTIYCYTPNFLQTAYNFKSLYSKGWNGAGQTILIVDAFGSPTITNDLHVFDTIFGIPDPPSFTILCPAGCPATTTAGPHSTISWAFETSLDVEYAHAMAPGANIVLVVAPTSSGASLNLVETQTMPLYPGSVMSQSFGIPEPFVHNNNAQIIQAHANYQTAANLGITVLASAGDFGATNGFTFQNALYPSSDPLVTAVGGTQGNPFGNLVTFTSPCNVGRLVPPTCFPVAYGAEAVWNEAWLGPPAAGGGAQSLLFGVPTYQSGLGLSSRGTPDISYNAAVDGGVLVFTSFLGGNFLFIVGGTSAGSPQWASIFAIVNQIRASNGKSPIGFANPALYALAESKAYSKDFHDITVGNNALGGVLSGNNAQTGWDLASGWGTPNAANLAMGLANS